MNEDKIKILKYIKNVLIPYKIEGFRIGKRMRFEDRFYGFNFEGPIIDIKDLGNELHIKIIDRTNSDSEENEITIKFLGYEQPTYKDSYEFEVIEAFPSEADDEIIEIITGQCNEECERFVIRI